MKSFREYLTEAKGFKKSRNPNQGSGRRGVVHIDIIAPNEQLANKMESALVEEGYESAEYGDDMGSDGYLFSMMINSSELKEFNSVYDRLKKEIK